MPSRPTTTATDGAAPAADPIDALIPPPWSPGRRLAVALVVVALTAAVVVTVRSGLVGPQLEHPPAWGYEVEATADGALVAERLAPIRNAGMLPVDLQVLELPPIDGVTWGDVTGLPTTLQPGEQVEVTIRFEVTSCTPDVGGFDVFPVRARSGIVPERVVAIAAPFSDDPELRGGPFGPDGPAEILDAWAEQPPSWVLDTIAPSCLDPDARTTVGGANS